jgi:molybdopterin adenylyltransferase
VPDEIESLQKEIINCVDTLKVDLLLISGGTGFALRDVTPEALSPLLDKYTPGISEAIRAYSITITKKAMLSRAISGIRKDSLIITLPGSPKAVEESLLYILEPLKHGLDILIGSALECARKD